MRTPGTIEYIIIALYFVFMLATGQLFRRLNTKFSDYFRSGCRATWWLVGSSVFMASFTAWTFTGAVGVAYEAGITVAIIFFANAFGYLINALFTARLFRQLRATTTPEVLQQRFDTKTQQFYVLMGIVPGILMSSLTLWGVALFASSVFGFPLVPLMIVLGAIVLIYSTAGGIWAVMATDFIQALILLPMTILVAWLSLQSIGGFEGFFMQIREQDLGNLLVLLDDSGETAYTSGWAIAMLLFVFVSYNSIGSSVKFFACKDGNEARKAAGLASLLMFCGAFLWFLPPLVARMQFAELVDAQPISKPPESAYAIISTQLLPNGLTGMIVVAMFAATMSSLSTGLNQFAAVITQDVYKPFLRRNAGEREMFVAGQVASFFTGILIVLTAIHLSQREGEGLFDFMLLFGGLLLTPMIVPMFLVLFIRRTPPWSAIFSVCVSFVYSYLGWINGYSYERNVLTILAVGTLSFVATIPFWQYSSAAYRAKVEAFYRKMATPVDFEREVGGGNDAGQLKMVGAVSLSVGLFVLGCLVIPNPLEGRLQILFVAGCIITFGATMIFLGWRRSAPPVQSTPPTIIAVEPAEP